jgi:hypothetical protein
VSGVGGLGGKAGFNVVEYVPEVAGGTGMELKVSHAHAMHVFIHRFIHNSMHGFIYADIRAIRTTILLLYTDE